MLDKKQLIELKRRVSNLVCAEVADSWKGKELAADQDVIENYTEQCRQEYNAFLNSITSKYKRGLAMKVNPMELELPKLRSVPDLTEEEAKVFWNFHLRTRSKILIQGKKVLDGLIRVKAAQTLKLPEIEVESIEEVLRNEPYRPISKDTRTGTGTSPGK